MAENILISFGGYGVFLILGMVLICVPILAGQLLRPNKPNPAKNSIYECGEPTIGSSWIRYNIRFYATALDFLIFDVEVVLLLPVAVVLRQLVPVIGLGPAVAAFLAIGVFIVVLTVGLAYAWRHGTIEWVLTDEAPNYAEDNPLIMTRPDTTEKSDAERAMAA